MYTLREISTLSKPTEIYDYLFSIYLFCHFCLPSDYPLLTIGRVRAPTPSLGPLPSLLRTEPPPLRPKTTLTSLPVPRPYHLHSSFTRFGTKYYSRHPTKSFYHIHTVSGTCTHLPHLHFQYHQPLATRALQPTQEVCL